MKELLAKFEEQLIRLGIPVLQNMNPGLPFSILNKKLSALNISVPQEIIDLYAWRNGANEGFKQLDGIRHLFRRAILMNIDKVIIEYNHFVKLDLDYYENSYFPIFESLGEEFLVVDCNPSSDSYNMILSYAIKGVYLSNGAVPLFDSPQRMIETVMRCYDKKAYYYDNSKNQLIGNIGLEKGFIVEMNPRANKVRRS